MINKKAQLTNPMTWVIILSLISILSLLLLTFQYDLAGDPQSYISDESRLDIYNKAGFKIEGQTFNSEIININDTDDPIYANENESENLKDYALEFQFYREKTQSFRTTVQDIYNLPIYFINIFDLDLQNWKGVVNALNFIIWWVIFFLIYKVIRGLIK